MTARGTWKQHERQAASLFGTLRKPGSGSQGREDMTRSDSVHPRLFIEQRTRAQSIVRTWLMEARRLARKEHKTAILTVREKGKPGAIVCVHETDLDRIVIEYAALHAARLWPEIVTMIRANHGVVDPDEICLPTTEG